MNYTLIITLNVLRKEFIKKLISKLTISNDIYFSTMTFSGIIGENNTRLFLGFGELPFSREFLETFLSTVRQNFPLSAVFLSTVIFIYLFIVRADLFYFIT